MNTGMNWSSIRMDRVQPIASFDVSKDEGLREGLNWKIMKPLFKIDNLRECSKFDLLDYRFQFNKAYQFIKPIDEEELNKNLHR